MECVPAVSALVLQAALRVLPLAERHRGAAGNRGSAVGEVDAAGRMCCR